MTKYIDADRLRAEIDKEINILQDLRRGCGITEYGSGGLDAFRKIKSTLDSLQQEQLDEVLIPKWCLENIENTLRIQHNINNDAKDGETCQDRNIKESLNCVRKLLSGEEITGRERSEFLMKQPEVDLEKEIVRFLSNSTKMNKGACRGKYAISDIGFRAIARHFYERGQRKAAEMYDEIEYNRQRATGVISFEYRIVGRNTIENLDMSELEKAGIGWGDNVIVQIRKKEENK